MLPQARQNETFEKDTGITAELLWTSAMPHEGQQVDCSLSPTPELTEMQLLY